MLQEHCKLNYVTAKLFTLNTYDRVLFLSMWQLVYSLRCDVPIVLLKSQNVKYTLVVKTLLYYMLYIANDGK
jgi:hypothetical protein